MKFSVDGYGCTLCEGEGGKYILVAEIRGNDRSHVFIRWDLEKKTWCTSKNDNLECDDRDNTIAFFKTLLA